MASFMRHVSVTARCAMEYRNERLKPIGLCGIQYSYIIHICRNPGVNQEELSHLIHVNKSNVTRQLTALEESGFILRKPDPADRRSVMVYPTEKAEAALPVIISVLHDWRDYLTEGFTPEEKEMLASMMERVAARAVDYMEGDGVLNGAGPKKEE